MDRELQPRIAFVCRGSRLDGLGHIMRSRTVAGALAGRAVVQLCAIGDQTVIPLLQHHGLPFEVHADEQGLLRQLRCFAPHVVVFDTMHIGDDVFAFAKQQAKVASLSPIFSHLGSVDLLFHRTRHGGTGWGEWTDGPRKFMGLDYAVVRQTCRPIPESVYEETLGHEVLSVAVSMGGSDAGNRTLRVLDALRAVPVRLLVWVLLGEGYAHAYEPLVECVRRDQRHEILLVKATDSMWRIMRACSLAVLAGGTITYEAAYAGLPSINLLDQPEHAFLIQELVERGCSRSAGHPFDTAVSRAAIMVGELEQHRDELLVMHRACRGAIDGQAADRIARELTACANLAGDVV